METHDARTPYEPPRVEILEVNPEGIVCASSGDFPYFPEQNW